MKELKITTIKALKKFTSKGVDVGELQIYGSKDSKKHDIIGYIERGNEGRDIKIENSTVILSDRKNIPGLHSRLVSAGFKYVGPFNMCLQGKVTQEGGIYKKLSKKQEIMGCLFQYSKEDLEKLSASVDLLKEYIGTAQNLKNALPTPERQNIVKDLKRENKIFEKLPRFNPPWIDIDPLFENMSLSDYRSFIANKKEEQKEKLTKKKIVLQKLENKNPELKEVECSVCLQKFLTDKNSTYKICSRTCENFDRKEARHAGQRIFVEFMSENPTVAGVASTLVKNTSNGTVYFSPFSNKTCCIAAKSSAPLQYLSVDGGAINSFCDDFWYFLGKGIFVLERNNEENTKIERGTNLGA